MAYVGVLVFPQDALAQRALRSLWDGTNAVPNTPYLLRIVPASATGDRYFSLLNNRDGSVVPNASFTLSGNYEITPVEGSPGVFQGFFPNAPYIEGLEPRLTVRVGDQTVVNDQPLNFRREPPPPPPGQAKEGAPPPGTTGAKQGGPPGGVGGVRPPGFSIVPCGVGSAETCTVQDLKKLGVNIFNFLLAMGGAAALLALVVAGMKYITGVLQGADESSIKNAKQNLTYAVVGLLVLLMAFVIVRTVTSTLGLNLQETPFK